MTRFQPAATPGRNASHAASRERGAAMILAMGWGVIMLILVFVVTTAVTGQIRPSDRSEQSLAALSAAEAGLADLDARLQVGTITSVLSDESNLALAGWVPVPGGDTDSEFTYAVDATKAGAVGEVRAYSTGRAGGVTRTVEAVLSKRSTLDYVYMSDIESPSPLTPGVYGSNQDAAERLCDRRWVQPGPVKFSSGSVTQEGKQRNLRFCKWAGIFNSEKISGRIHTNDIWWLQETNLSGVIDEGAITSSCRSAAEGLQPGEVGCDENRRYIGTSSGPSRSTSPRYYQGDGWRSSGTDRTNRNPEYDSVLDLPASPDLLKQRAAEAGCIYTGPTRIRFFVDGDQGYYRVTSPDTNLTRPGCDGIGGDGTSLRSDAEDQVTATVRIDDFSDLVIYVQSVPNNDDVPGADYEDPSQKYYWERVNRSEGEAPTCQSKYGRLLPFVIPDDAGDSSRFRSRSRAAGFPSAYADPNSPWLDGQCASGDLFVDGDYRGALTLASEDNMALTGSLRDAQQANPAARVGDDDFGKPDPTSTSVLGVVAGGFAYIYRPTEADEDWVRDWRDENADNPVFNFALLAIQQCFGSQDYNIGPRNGSIHLWGSIAQKYRCAVGINNRSGYGKKYKYDDRLTLRTPPYMLELSDEPWGDERTGEVNPEVLTLGTEATIGLLADGEEGLSIRNVRLASAPDTSKVNLSADETSGEVSVTSNVEGLVVVVYEVGSPGDWQIRRLVTLVE